jgi:hypothetical protein
MILQSKNIEFLNEILSSCFTNLTCDELKMKIMQSSFIHKFIHFIHNMTRWKHIWHMDKCVDKWSINIWTNECHMNFASFNKFVCQMCFQCTISMCEMYEFCMISITKSWDVKLLWCGHYTFVGMTKTKWILSS